MSIDEQRWIDVWNSRDDDAIAALCTEDVVVNAVVLGIEPRRYTGRQGVRDWLQDVRNRFHADTRVERGTTVDDETLILEGTLVIGDDPNQLRNQSFALLFRLRGDLAEWVGTFITADQARDALARGIV